MDTSTFFVYHPLHWTIELIALFSYYQEEKKFPLTTLQDIVCVCMSVLYTCVYILVIMSVSTILCKSSHDLDNRLYKRPARALWFETCTCQKEQTMSTRTGWNVKASDVAKRAHNPIRQIVDKLKIDSSIQKSFISLSVGL